MRFNSWFIVSVFLSLVLINSRPVNAEIRQGIEVTIAQDEVIEDDVYVIAQKLTVNGTVRGDLIAFAQVIEVNGVIDGDLIASAQQVLVNGKVKDDVRTAGQVLQFKDGADIGDDLVAAGFSLECTSASQVKGELNFAGFQSELAGSIGKKVRLASGNTKLSGTFGDDIEAIVDGGNYASAGIWAEEVPDIPPGLTVTESAQISGSLRYTSSREATINPQSTIEGEVEHSQVETEAAEAQAPSIVDRAIALAKKFFACLLVGLLVVFICPKWTEQVVNNVQHRPLASLGWGAVTFIAVCLSVIMLLFATIGIAILLGLVSLSNLILAWVGVGVLTTAVVVVGFWIFSAWIAHIIVCVWAGNRIIHGPDWISKRRFLALGVGLLIFIALTQIPTAGGIISLVVMFAGIGSTAIWMFTKSEPVVAAKPEPIGK